MKYVLLLLVCVFGFEAGLYVFSFLIGVEIFWGTPLRFGSLFFLSVFLSVFLPVFPSGFPSAAVQFGRNHFSVRKSVAFPGRGVDQHKMPYHHGKQIQSRRWPVKVVDESVALFQNI